MVNQSKAQDQRFWRRWRESGAVSVMTFDSQKHPEIRVGEVWLTNSDSCDFMSISWNTKRRGVVALDSLGRPIGQCAYLDYFPVFVQKSELDAAGVEVNDKCKRVRFYKPFS